MRKKQRIYIFLILTLTTTFLLAFRTIWKQDKPTVEKSEKKLSKSFQYEPSMKPAWYRFFIPTNTEKTTTKSAKLHFLIEEHPTMANFLNITLFNASKQDILLPTQNRSLIMIQEAKDPNGIWKAIEYWNKDWQTPLNIKERFELVKNKSILCTAPQYVGDFKTKIRFKLKIIGANFTEKIICSPEFEGSINLGQFSINWDKEARLKPENVCYLDE